MGWDACIESLCINQGSAAKWRLNGVILQVVTFVGFAVPERFLYYVSIERYCPSVSQCLPLSQPTSPLVLPLSGVEDEVVLMMHPLMVTHTPTHLHILPHHIFMPRFTSSLPFLSGSFSRCILFCSCLSHYHTETHAGTLEMTHTYHLQRHVLSALNVACGACMCTQNTASLYTHTSHTSARHSTVQLLPFTS